MSNISEGCTVRENALKAVLVTYKQLTNIMKSVARDVDFFCLVRMMLKHLDIK